jgi:hypothetical protein
MLDPEEAGRLALDPQGCPGPLLWFAVPRAGGGPAAGLLGCSWGGCGYVVATGSLNDRRHAYTPVQRVSEAAA